MLSSSFLTFSTYSLEVDSFIWIQISSLCHLSGNKCSNQCNTSCSAVYLRLQKLKLVLHTEGRSNQWCKSCTKLPAHFRTEEKVLDWAKHPHCSCTYRTAEQWKGTVCQQAYPAFVWTCDETSICRLTKKKPSSFEEVWAELPFLSAFACLSANIFTVVSKEYIDLTKSWLTAEVFNIQLRLSYFMKRSVQEDAETEDFAMKGVSVNVQMDFTGLTVRKVILKKIFSTVFFTIISKNLQLLLSNLSYSEDFIYFESTRVPISVTRKIHGLMETLIANERNILSLRDCF